MSKREPMSIGAFGRWCFIAMLAASLLCAIVAGLTYRRIYVMSDPVVVEVVGVSGARSDSSRSQLYYEVYLLTADGREAVNVMKRPWKVGEVHVARVHRKTGRVAPTDFMMWMPSVLIGAWALFVGGIYCNIRYLERKEAIEAAQGER